MAKHPTVRYGLDVEVGRMRYWNISVTDKSISKKVGDWQLAIE